MEFKILEKDCVWSDLAKDSRLYQGDCIAVMDRMIEEHPDGCFDMIFADPPYFLSNGGLTCQSGKMVSVNKGKWDKSRGFIENQTFISAWLARCQQLLRPNGTIWVSGTMHIIYCVGFTMQQLGYKLLNDIVWEKPNPPPNLACRYFTHATETLLWAAKNSNSKHHFNYGLMKHENDGKQMKSVWRMTAPSKLEKQFGKHPTQKPLALLARCIKASTEEGALVFDPFAGSSTTGVAALQLGRRFFGIEFDSEFIALSTRRLNNII